MKIYGIIITGHGNFAGGLQETIELVLGHFNNIKYVNFKEGNSLDIFKEKLKSAIEELSFENIICLTDIQGGTPYSTAVILNSELEKNIKVLSGCNFPMIVSALDECDTDKSIDLIIEDIIQFGREGIDIFKVKKKSEIEFCGI